MTRIRFALGLAGICPGDLLVNGIANLIDGYVNEWPDALEKLKAIDFVDVIPGHGEPFKGKEPRTGSRPTCVISGSRRRHSTIRKCRPRTRRGGST